MKRTLLIIAIFYLTCFNLLFSLPQGGRVFSLLALDQEASPLIPKEYLDSTLHGQFVKASTDLKQLTNFLQSRGIQISSAPDESSWYPYHPNNSDKAKAYLLLKNKVWINEKDVVSAQSRKGHLEQYEVLISLNKLGSNRLQKMTQVNLGNLVAIVVKGKVISAPKVQQVISGGQLMITGNFSKEEADQLSSIFEK